MKKLSLGSAALVPLFRRRGLEPATAVKQVYATLYGEIAPSLPALEFADGVLSLGTRSAAWRREGERMADSLMAGLNCALGDAVVRRIDFVAWRKAGKKPRSGKKQIVAREPSKELLAASQRIEDERVREAFVRFGAAIEAAQNGQEQ